MEAQGRRTPPAADFPAHEAEGCDAQRVLYRTKNTGEIFLNFSERTIIMHRNSACQLQCVATLAYRTQVKPGSSALCSLRSSTSESCSAPAAEPNKQILSRHIRTRTSGLRRLYARVRV